MLHCRPFFLFLAIFIMYSVNAMQSYASPVASVVKNLPKIVSAAKVANTMWGAIKGDVKNDGSNDAYIGLLLAKQFLTMGRVDVGENGELYINQAHIKNPKVAFIYLDQRAELLSPVFIQTGGYAALNTVLLEQARGGAVIISQHLESRGRLTVAAGASFDANSIKVINDTRGN